MRVEQIITDRIVKLLEAGTVPWHKPWANRQTGIDAFPRNAITKRHYIPKKKSSCAVSA
jgi:antirestriction protein ArdC